MIFLHEHEEKCGSLENDPICFHQAKESSNSHSWIIFKQNSVSLKDSFRTIMARVVLFDLKLHPMDAVIAFLNGNIEETIYKVQIENFMSGDPKSIVRNMTKNIYGLKQPSCQWYHKSH